MDKSFRSMMHAIPFALLMLGASLVGLACSERPAGDDGEPSRDDTSASSDSAKEASDGPREYFAFQVENLMRLSDGSMCMGCPDQVDVALEGLAGVQATEWDFANDIVFVEVAAGGPSVARIAQTITETGFPATLVERERPRQEQQASGAGDVEASQWPEPIAAALAEVVAKQRELVIVYFHAPWCPPCERLKAETFADSSIEAFIEQHAIFLDIDAEHFPDVSRAVGLQAVPDVRVLKADGTQAAQIQGFGTAEQFLAIFEQARQ